MSDVFANFVANLWDFLALRDLESGDDATKNDVVDRKLPEVITMLSTLFDQFFLDLEQYTLIRIIHWRQTKKRSESFQPFCKAPKVPKVECHL